MGSEMCIRDRPYTLPTHYCGPTKTHHHMQMDTTKPPCFHENRSQKRTIHTKRPILEKYSTPPTHHAAASSPAKTPHSPTTDDDARRRDRCSVDNPEERCARAIPRSFAGRAGFARFARARETRSMDEEKDLAGIRSFGGASLRCGLPRRATRRRADD